MSCETARAFPLPFSLRLTHPIFAPWRRIPTLQKTRQNPRNPRRQVPAPDSRANSKASRPDVQPIGPALAELLNPAINRGDSGLGSGTGLQPPPDNSWDRRAGGEAAAHRARASTRGASEDVAKRDAVDEVRPARAMRGGTMPLPPLPPRAKRVAGRGRGWGVSAHTHLTATLPRHPPPPTSRFPAPPLRGGGEERRDPS